MTVTCFAEDTLSGCGPPREGRPSARGSGPRAALIPRALASDRWARGAVRGPRALIGGVADRRRGAMTVAVTRKELGAVELRREAGRCRDARAARRMLALALVLEGASRAEAARAAGMDRKTLRDWVHRYNEEGLAGLRDRHRPGPRPRLTPEQEDELAGVVERGPGPDRDGAGRWRRGDLEALIDVRDGVALHERSVGKVPRRLGFARISVRPKHTKSDEAAPAAFKKASPLWSRRRCPSTPVPDRSRSGFRTRPASAGRAP